jgi:hypothetical protein
MLTEIDVALVAARRPQLLELTLRSFRMNLLRHLKVRRLYVNIDPIWGDEDDAATVRALCKLYFTDVLIFEPESPGFGLAVKTLWSKIETDWFLHLEDDWCLQWRIDVNRLSRETEDREIGQVSFWNRWNHHKAWRRGVWMRKFTTSPSFVRREVGQNAGALLDPNFDPERQLYDGRNQALLAALSQYRHRVHGSRFTPLCIVDVGADWRRLRGIQKDRSDGVSTWSEPTARLGSEASRAVIDRYERRLSLSQFLPRI